MKIKNQRHKKLCHNQKLETIFEIRNNIPDHPYRILIVEDSGPTKTNLLFNLLSHQSDIDKKNLF